MKLKLGLVALVLALSLLMVVPCAQGEATTEEEVMCQTAYNYLINSPTFLFDGVEDSVELLDSCGREFTYKFTCANSGYGDRTDQIVAPVYTDHTVVIAVSCHKVIYGVIDDVWNMKTQESSGWTDVSKFQRIVSKLMCWFNFFRGG